MSAAPWWLRPAPLPPATLPRRADVVVVGGGITGVATLLALQERGVDAVLVERRHVAAGASGRNAGLLLTGTADSYAAAVRRHGRAVAAEVWAFSAASHDLLVAALGPAGERTAGHRRTGAWTLAASPAEAEELVESATLLAEDSLEGRWFERPETVPPAAHGGLLVPGDGVIDPAAAVGVLAATAWARRPGAVVEGVAVEAVEPRGSGVDVATTAGEVRAGAVVLAVNGWSAELAPALRIEPVRAQMLATAPAGPGGAGPAPAYSDRGNRYWRWLDQGTLLLGGCRELAGDAELGTDARPTAAVQAHLDAFLGGHFGVTAAVTHRWAGTMGFTPDRLPLVGAVPGLPGVHVCGGYSGHGMGLAVHAGRALAACLSAGAALPAWLAPGRHREPGRDDAATGAGHPCRGGVAERRSC